MKGGPNCGQNDWMAVRGVGPCAGAGVRTLSHLTLIYVAGDTTKRKLEPSWRLGKT